MNGLAEQISGQPVVPPQPAGPQAETQQQGKLPSVQEVMALLMQGVDPQKLIEMGIPQELVMQAIQILEQQLASQERPSGAPAEGMAQDQGLAAQSAGM